MKSMTLTVLFAAGMAAVGHGQIGGTRSVVPSGGGAYNLQFTTGRLLHGNSSAPTISSPGFSRYVVKTDNNGGTVALDFTADGPTSLGDPNFTATTLQYNSPNDYNWEANPEGVYLSPPDRNPPQCPCIPICCDPCQMNSNARVKKWPDYDRCAKESRMVATSQGGPITLDFGNQGIRKKCATNDSTKNVGALLLRATDGAGNVIWGRHHTTYEWLSQPLYIDDIDGNLVALQFAQYGRLEKAFRSEQGKWKTIQSGSILKLQVRNGHGKPMKWLYNVDKTLTFY